MRYAHVSRRITPRVGTPLAGCLREPTSHGIYDDLYLQGLLLDDERKGKLLLFSADLVGFDTDFANRMRRWIARQDSALTPASIVLSATHTHCGPATARFAPSYGRYNERYVSLLERHIKDCVRDLMKAPMKPGSLHCGTGRCSLAMNRRLVIRDRDGRVKDVLMKPNPGGPVDHSLGVVQVRGKGEDVVLFNYACHPTTRAGYMISGDYPAAAVRTLRASRNGTRAAMFLLGAAGDLRVPCTSEDGSSFVDGDSDRVIEYGNLVAGAVERVIKMSLHRVTPSFASTRVGFKLPYGTQRPQAMTEERYRRREEPRDGVPLEWTVWKLAPDCMLMAVPGEFCHAIGKRAKKMSGVKVPLFVGYANGLPCYVPTDRILDEGGYEADGSMSAYGRPYLLKTGIDRILRETLARALSAVGV